MENCLTIQSKIIHHEVQIADSPWYDWFMMMKHGVKTSNQIEPTTLFPSDAFTWDNRIGYAEIECGIFDSTITTADGGTTYECPRRIDIISRRNGVVYHFEMDVQFMNGEQIRCVAYKMCDCESNDKRTKRVVISLERD